MSGLCAYRHERGEDLVDGRLGQPLHLLVGPVLDRMGHEHSCRLETQGAGLRLRRGDKLRGGDEHPGEAPALQVGDVVHTARRAAASVGERFDHQIALGGDLVAKVEGGHLGEGGLVVAEDPEAGNPGA